MASLNARTDIIGVAIRVRGTVQGVGFRPTVYRLARALGLRGIVLNDGEGVLIRVAGPVAAIADLVQHLQTDCPPLARIDRLEQAPLSPLLIDQSDFRIVESHANGSRTAISPDAATCSHCYQDTFDPCSRYFRYPFTNCTHCGPRLSLIQRIPYDRANTSMAAFSLCPACHRAYTYVEDRRFHAQPIACPVCGPQVWLESAGAPDVSLRLPGTLDAIDAARQLIQQGQIVAIKGIGGVHLACDATQAAAVQRLRLRKRRDRQPFALMAPSLQMIEQYCQVGTVERQLLLNPAAPIVLLQQRPQPAAASPPLAAAVAPGVSTLGFMMPYTPLHHLLLAEMTGPIVLTSGNAAGTPQCIDNDEARQHLGAIADYFLLHNRDIVNRVDDSVVQVRQQRPQLLRRARGYAPAPLPLPPGFQATPPILAMGGELKNTLCLLHQGQAIVSQHLGDLEDGRAYQCYQDTLMRYCQIFAFEPQAIAVDLHPEYLSSKLGKTRAAAQRLPLHGIQHHHAHIAACLADNGVALDTSPVLGIALDGLGYGSDQGLWGGEVLMADYRESWRLGGLKPVALLGGAQAVRQPWRNTYAHLMAAFAGDWQALRRDYGGLEMIWYLEGKPRSLLDQMLAQSLNAPLASSAGRLFDAVAAAVGLCRDGVSYEGQAAIELEALVTDAAVAAAPCPYPFQVDEVEDTLVLNPAPMWRSLLDDLKQNTPAAVIAAQFHLGLAAAIAALAEQLAQRFGLTQVVLSGGVFQNQVLSDTTQHHLINRGFSVFTHQQVPANDGGLSLGQAVIAAARTLCPVSPAP